MPSPVLCCVVQLQQLRTQAASAASPPTGGVIRKRSTASAYAPGALPSLPPSPTSAALLARTMSRNSDNAACSILDDVRGVLVHGVEQQLVPQTGGGESLIRISWQRILKKEDSTLVTQSLSFSVIQGRSYRDRDRDSCYG